MRVEGVQLVLELQLLAQRGQILQHLPRRGVAVFPFLLERLQYDAVELRRHAFDELRRRRRAAVGDGPSHVEEVVALYWRLAGDHFVEHRSERVEVGAGVGLLAARLLGRDVDQRPHHRAGVAVLQRIVQELRQAEVEHFDVPVVAQHDVLRLDVAVDDARLVGRPESARHADTDAEHLTDAQLMLGDLFAQGRAVDVLRGDEMRPIDFADVVDGDDVRVIQCRGGAGLALKAADALLVHGEARREEL